MGGLFCGGERSEPAEGEGRWGRGGRRGVQGEGKGRGARRAPRRSRGRRPPAAETVRRTVCPAGAGPVGAEGGKSGRLPAPCTKKRRTDCR